MKEKLNSIDAKTIAVKLIALAVLAGIVYQFRPLFHPIIYTGMFTIHGIIIFGGSAVTALILYLLPPLIEEHEPATFFNSLQKKTGVFGFVLGILVLLGILAGVPAGMAYGADLSTNTMGDADNIDTLPQTNPDNPRIVPRAVADTQTRGSTSYRQHELGPSDIARAENGNLVWSYAIQPDQFMNRLRNNQRGVLLSEMTRLENRSITAYDDQEFTYGQNMLLHRSANWNMLKGDFFVQYNDEPVEFTHDGEAYMHYPKTGHEWRLGPFPHTVPTWEGNALVHQNGTIEHLTPEEAQNNEILAGQRLYPLYNSEKRVESLNYRNGIINQLPLLGTFKNVVVPAEMPSGSGNSQPFVIDLQGEEMSYVYAMEAHGESSNGLDEVWFYDARTGESQYLTFENTTIFGPKRAMGLVRSEDSQTGWIRSNQGEETGNFRVVEPVLTAIDGDVYWHAKVVPAGNTDVSRTAFVNAETGTVVEFENTENIKEFIREADIDEIPNDAETDTEPAPDDPNVAYYIVITNSDGKEVNRIEVAPGQEITIEQP